MILTEVGAAHLRRGVLSHLSVRIFAVDETDIPGSTDRWLASAAQFLIDGGEEDAASLLLSCSLDVWASGDSWFVGDESHEALHIVIRGPRAAYEALDSHTEVGAAIWRAVEALRPSETYIKHRETKPELIEIDNEWRTELLEIARGRGVHNQAPTPGPGRRWKTLNFRSQSEIRIAEELDRAGVMFFPNCRARVSDSENTRVIREPDFLVCHEGRWGVLEVDGEPFHPPTRTTSDHERDRIFRSHGVRVVEHFDATRCFNEPEGVVRDFLKLLAVP